MKLINLLKEIRKGVAKNYDKIITIFSVGGILWLIAKYGNFDYVDQDDFKSYWEHAGYSFEEDDEEEDDDCEDAPKNPTEAKLLAIKNSAMLTDSDYNKTNYAKMIVDVIENAYLVDDDTLTFAIMILNALAEKTEDEYYRDSILKKIVELEN